MSGPPGLWAGAQYPHDALWDALREVPDPEMGISLVDMGLIVDLRQRRRGARDADLYGDGLSGDEYDRRRYSRAAIGAARYARGRNRDGLGASLDEGAADRAGRDALLLLGVAV